MESDDRAGNMCEANGIANQYQFETAPNSTQARARSLNSDEIALWDPTQEEKELIKLTWSDDFSFLYELGSNIYIYIFSQVPECKTLFPNIHKYGDNYKDSREFRSQALKFVQTLSYAVKNLYHMDHLAPYLYSIGERHVKFSERGFKPEYWNVFLDAIEVVLADKIASIEQFDEKQRQITTKVWRRLAFYIITHMKRGYFDKLERQRAN